jgi:hypothetical protein
MKATTNKQEINEVIKNLNNGVQYLNEVADYQFVKRADGLMLKFSKGKYTFFTDEIKFAKAIIRTVKRGY